MESNWLRGGVTSPPTAPEGDKLPSKLVGEPPTSSPPARAGWLDDGRIIQHESHTGSGDQRLLFHASCHPSRLQRCHGRDDASNVISVSCDSRRGACLDRARRQIAPLPATPSCANGFFFPSLPTARFFCFLFKFFFFLLFLAGDSTSGALHDKKLPS